MVEYVGDRIEVPVRKADLHGQGTSFDRTAENPGPGDYRLRTIGPTRIYELFLNPPGASSNPMITGSRSNFCYVSPSEISA